MNAQKSLVYVFAGVSTLFFACSGTSNDSEGSSDEDLTGATCKPVAAAAVTAKGDDGKNKAENTIDSKKDSRWSNSGKGSWIQYDLGEEKELNGTSIAWYKGDKRKAKFEIGVSSDGEQFTKVFSGKSSGKSADAETYAFKAKGRYLKITVNGNSDNEWASITEVAACSESGTDVGAGDGGTPAEGDGGGSGGGGGGGGGGEGLTGDVDKNGVAYIRLDGFKYASERDDWTKNFKSNGSMRHDFEKAPDENQCVVGYFNIQGPDDEEISAKLASGPHTDGSKAKWADTYDIGIINFEGSRARVRFEKTHPDYTGGINQKVSIGDIRGKWVGAMGMKLNIDQDKDGKTDHVRVLAYVDPEGLDGDKPKNGWVKTFDKTFELSEVKLKTPTTPYVVTIGHPDEAQATIRVDGQKKNSYQYKYLAYRVLAWE